MHHTNTLLATALAASTLLLFAPSARADAIDTGTYRIGRILGASSVYEWLWWNAAGDDALGLGGWSEDRRSYFRLEPGPDGGVRLRNQADHRFLYAPPDGPVEARDDEGSVFEFVGGYGSYVVPFGNMQAPFEGYVGRLRVRGSDRYLAPTADGTWSTVSFGASWQAPAYAFHWLSECYAEQVWWNGEDRADIARGKAVRQSTGAAADRPEAAIDGDLCGPIADVHGGDSVPWWEIDLGQETLVANIRIWRGPSAHHDAVVALSATHSGAALMTATEGVQRQRLDSNALNIVSPGASVRYIRIYAPLAQGALSLSEVQIVGTPVPEFDHWDILGDLGWGAF